MYLTLSAVTVALRSLCLSPETIANRHTHAADPEVALRTPTRPWLLNYWSTIVILWVESVGFKSFTDHRTRNRSPPVVSALTTATTSSIYVSVDVDLRTSTRPWLLDCWSLIVILCLERIWTFNHLQDTKYVSQSLAHLLQQLQHQ